jgi:hypothetical protein
VYLGVAAAFLWAAPLRADDDLDSLLGGFEEDPPAMPTPAESAGDGQEHLVRISAEARLGASINYAQDAPDDGNADYRGLSRLDAGLRVTLEADWKGLEMHAVLDGSRDFVYPIKKRDEFTHAVLETYEADLELGELWVRASPLPRLDVKLGRQVVAWGRSETLRVVDVLNPSDNREPGLADLVDLRLPVAMTRFDYYVGSLAFTGIAIHETRFNKEPPQGSDFIPPGLVIPGVRRPGNAGDDTEWAAAISGRFEGWDASLHWARIYEDRPSFDPESGLLEFARRTLVGVTGNYAVGNWLLKGEVARSRGIRLANVPRRRFARSDVLIGAEYSGFRESNLAIEMVTRKLHGYESVLSRAPDMTDETRLETAVRFIRDFRNDSLRLTVLAVLFGEWGREGATYRASLRQELRDALSVEIGVLVYEGGDDPRFQQIDENDRIFLSIRQSF